jgi:hypothetical protein
MHKSAIFANTPVYMKKTVSFIVALQCCIISAMAQQVAMPSIDKSPVDISYYPVNYPALKIQDKVTEPLAARVVYSRPKKEGRVIFGGLVEYGKVWRLGANEATEIEFFKHVRINGKKISKGRYTLYAIVNENSWTIIVNKETDTWGAFKYDAKKDVVRMDIPVQRSSEMLESLAMTFEKSITGINLIIGWDMIKVSLPINF